LRASFHLKYFKNGKWIQGKNKSGPKVLLFDNFSPLYCLNFSIKFIHMQQRKMDVPEQSDVIVLGISFSWSGV
jgi:hypothetical protein